MIFKTFTFPDLSINSYLIGDENTKHCVVIDPPRFTKPIEDYIRAQSLTLMAILETHVHADFISGALELKHAFNNKPIIMCSEAGGKEWLPQYADKGVKDGELFYFGPVKFKAVHTPGHTPEHISWLFYDPTPGSITPVLAFTGDFLFVNGVGRPDLLGPTQTASLFQELYKSIFGRIARWPESTVIYPAHGAGSLCGKSIGTNPSSTLAEERKHSPAFQSYDMDFWITKIGANIPAAPKSFARNKKINLTGAPLTETLPKAKENITAENLKSFLSDSGWILDFRDPADFGQSHLKGAVNVPLSPAVGNWLASILPEKVPLVCIIPDEKQKERIGHLIRILGYDQPLGFTTWEQVKNAPDLTTLENLNPDRLKALQKEAFILDVRTPEEWKKGHIDDAHHIELSLLLSELANIPEDKTIVTVCGGGSGSSLAASLLQREGFPKVFHLAGGMQAWNAI